MSSVVRLAIQILALIALTSVVHAEAPFAFEQTPGQLPKDIVPRSYAIRIEPDIEKATLTGRVEISIEVRKPVRKIVLNALGLSIGKATLDGVELSPQLDPEKQTLALVLADELPVGTHTLAIEYRGQLTEQPEGLYLARYKVGDVEKTALATQFEATDARRMFPCWDEPVFRAAFQLTVVTPEKSTGISNMPIASEKKIEGGMKEVAFARTPSMASYLLAFCSGEFEALRGEVDGVQLGVYYTEGKREQARYALEATKLIVPYYNTYFGEKYPLPKLDQISFANSGASGMENWGCIIYNDSALLFDPATSSQSTRERVFEVVAHEIAHQWFGDLVTMAWWDNLWLNEGFASWMGTKATDHFNPEWKTWLRAAGEKEWAMALDARATTHPIQQPVANEAQAGDAFDEITYSKGQSFIRMLESYLGEDVFRDGIRKYMARHKYSSSTTSDLWIALENVSGKPVREFAAGWTEQPGFPVVKLSRGSDGLSLVQERFTLNQTGARPLAWKIPIRLGPAFRPEETATRVLDAEPIKGIAGRLGDVIKANLGDVGYFRVHYDPSTFDALVSHVHELTESDRLNLLNDTWALAQAGRISAEAYLDLASELATDHSYPVANQIVNSISFIDELMRGRAERDRFRMSARHLLQPQFTRLGWEPQEGETKLDDLLRNAVIRALGALGDDSVQDEARARFRRSLDAPSSLRGDLRDTVWWIVGRIADEATYGRLHSLAKRTDSVEEKRALYGALAAARPPALIQRTLAISLTSELPPQNAARLVQRVAGECEQPEIAWEFAKTNLDALFGKLSSIRANDYVPGIFNHFSDASRADELEVWAKANLPVDAAPATAKAADAIRFKADLKERIVPAIDAWCRARPHP